MIDSSSLKPYAVLIMNRIQGKILSTVFILTLLTGGSAVEGDSLFNESEILLSSQLEGTERPLCAKTVEGCSELTREMLAFYAYRQNRPAWTDDYGLLPQAEEMLEVIRYIDEEGLRPEDYQISALDRKLREVRYKHSHQQVPEATTLVSIDLLLTRAFFEISSHLLYGKLNPGDLHPLWRVNWEETGLIRKLSENLSQRGGVITLIQGIKPESPDYRRLKQALATYKKIQKSGGWPIIRGYDTLERGDHDNVVRVLRKRLAVTGDLVSDPGEDQSIFDENVERALTGFQKRHGILTDGVLGSLTRSALNVSVEEKIRLIEINLERWRWLARYKSKPYLLVDIPDFRLDVVSEDGSSFSMNVIVGEPDRQTPVMNDMITDVVINPYWYVPRTILLNDILPKEMNNPKYLTGLNIDVLTWKAGDLVTVDPLEVDWKNIESSISQFQFRQDPGPGNFLGRYKFIMSNDANIYLHDTLFKYHFDDRLRDLSSGCIRVERPGYLAEYLLKDEDNWPRQYIEEVLASGDPRRVTLTIPVPVYILYWTARADHRGIVYFPPDFYDLDKPMVKAFYAR